MCALWSTVTGEEVKKQLYKRLINYVTQVGGGVGVGGIYYCDTMYKSLSKIAILA